MSESPNMLSKFRRKIYQDCNKTAAEVLGPELAQACALALPPVVCDTSFKELTSDLCKISLHPTPDPVSGRAAPIRVQTTQIH